MSVTPCSPRSIWARARSRWRALAAYFAADPRGDFNAVDGITVQDIFDFLAAYFGGCD